MVLTFILDIFQNCHDISFHVNTVEQCYKNVCKQVKNYINHRILLLFISPLMAIISDII